MEYKMKIAGLARALPLCPLNENLYIGAFVMFGDVELTVAAATELLKIAPAYDVMITAESKGIPLAYEMARQRGGERWLLARKAPKLYMRGKRVLIVDDVISTGESLHALETLVHEAGGKVVGKMAVLAEGDATTRKDILYLEKLPLFNAEGKPID